MIFAVPLNFSQGGGGQPTTIGKRLKNLQCNFIDKSMYGSVVIRGASGAMCSYKFKSLFKEYSLEVRGELPQTMVADSQPSPRAGLKAP